MFHKVFLATFDVMKILLLTNHYPSPPNYGAAKRSYHLCQLLMQIGEVTLVVLKRSQSDSTQKDRLSQTKKDFSSLKVFHTDREPPTNLLGKINRLFNMKKVADRHSSSLSEEDRDELKGLAHKSDIVWCHTLEAADMGGIYDYGCSVIDLDDLNSDKRALQAQEKKGHAKWQKYWQALLWRRWEQDALQRFSAVAVCSKHDWEKIGAHKNVFVLPNGFEEPSHLFTFKRSQAKVLGFVGLVSYSPNAEAVRWFIKEIFPILLKKDPNIRFRVAGKLPVGGLGIEHPNMDVLGFVEELDTELQNWDAMVVPLKVGGGTRLKILEAFSKHIPVISTSLGAYGINAKHGQHLLLADEPASFAEQCLRLIRDRNMAEELTHNAYQLFRSNYTWETIGSEIKNIIHFVRNKNHT
jgi:glycosyltransferase involved in cell wall biosynthesis